MRAEDGHRRAERRGSRHDHVLDVSGSALAACVWLVVVLLASCASETSARATRSGITGTVVAGPTCPVETEESPCPDRPVADATVTAKGRPAKKSTQTASDGTFRMRLPHGSYQVTAKSESAFFCEERPVRVYRNQYTDVTITCDTGIR